MGNCLSWAVRAIAGLRLIFGRTRMGRGWRCVGATDAAEGPPRKANGRYRVFKTACSAVPRSHRNELEEECHAAHRAFFLFLVLPLACSGALGDSFRVR